MKRFIPYILPACLAMGFFFLTTEKTFSQADQAHTIGTTGSEAGEPSYVTGLTPARARSLVGAVSGLTSLIIGWRFRRSVAAGRGRSWAIAALALGVAAIVLSVVHLASITGGFGTGGGKAGAIVALVLGLTGTIFSGLSLRSKRK